MQAIKFMTAVLLCLVLTSTPALSSTQAVLEKTNLSNMEEGEHYADVNGVRLHYYVRGHKRPVLLVPSPGWGVNVNYLIPIRVFERHFTVVYVDTRLSGKSSGPADASQYTEAHFIGDIEAMRKHLGLVKFSLAGHSASGHLVLAYALEHGKNLTALITIDAIVARDSLRAAEMKGRIDKKAQEPYYKAHPAIYRKAYEQFYGLSGKEASLKQQLMTYGYFYLYEPSKAPALISQLSFNDTVNTYTDQAGYTTQNLLPELPRITVPTLIVSGDDDFICDPLTQATRMHGKIINSKLLIIKQSGHFPWVEQPQQFDFACEQWLRGLRL